MCRIFLYIQKQFNMSSLSYMSYQNHVGLQPANLVTSSHVLRSRRSELFSPSFFVPYVVFAFNFFLFSVRPPKKSVNLTVNLLFLLFHPHPHPRLLLFAPSYTYAPSQTASYTYVCQLQVTLRRQRILVGQQVPVLFGIRNFSRDWTSRQEFFWQVPVLLPVGNFSFPVRVGKFFVTGTAVIRVGDFSGRYRSRYRYCLGSGGFGTGQF